MPCTFDIKPEDRHCEYCTVMNCDSREPKEPETHACTSREWIDCGSLSLGVQLFNELMFRCQPSLLSWFDYKKETLLSNLRVELKYRWQRRKLFFYKNQVS